MQEYCFVVAIKEGRNLRFISTLDAQGIYLEDDAYLAIKWDCEEAANEFISLIVNHYAVEDLSCKDICVKVYSVN